MADRVRAGDAPTIPAWKPYQSPQIEMTIAAAQIRSSPSGDTNAKRMEKMIRDARRRGADVVAFPELAINGAKGLSRIQKAARKRSLYVVFATPADDGTD